MIGNPQNYLAGLFGRRQAAIANEHAKNHCFIKVEIYHVFKHHQCIGKLRASSNASASVDFCGVPMKKPLRLIIATTSLIVVFLTFFAVIAPGKASEHNDVLNRDFFALSSKSCYAGDTSKRNACLQTCNTAMQNYTTTLRKKGRTPVERRFIKSIRPIDIEARSYALAQCMDLAAGWGLKERANRREPLSEFEAMLQSSKVTDRDNSAICVQAFRDSGVKEGAAWARPFRGKRNWREIFNASGCDAYPRLKEREDLERTACSADSSNVEEVLKSGSIDEVQTLRRGAVCPDHIKALGSRLIELKKDRQEIFKTALKDGEGTDTTTRKNPTLPPAIRQVRPTVREITPVAPSEIETAPSQEAHIVLLPKLTPARKQPDDKQEGRSEDRERTIISRPKKPAVQISTCASDRRAIDQALFSSSYEQLEQAFAKVKCPGVLGRKQRARTQICNFQRNTFSKRTLGLSETRNSLQRRYDCPELVAMIDERLDQRQSSRQRAALCQSEFTALLEASNSYTAMTKLAGTLQCERSRERLALEQKRFCEYETETVGNLNLLNKSELGSLLATLNCSSIRQSVQGRLAVLNEQDVCIEMSDRVRRFSKDNRNAITQIANQTQCLVAAQLANTRLQQIDLARTCETDGERFANLSNPTIADLESFRETVRCKSIIARVVFTMGVLRRNAQCDTERRALAAFAATNDVVQIESLRKRARCTATVGLTDQTLARVRQEIAAQATLEAQQKAEEENEQSAMLASTSPDVETLRPQITVDKEEREEESLLKEAFEKKLEAEDAAKRERLAKALQSQLRRLNCYSGSIDGKYGNLSKNSAARYVRYYKTRNSRVGKIDPKTASMDAINGAIQELKTIKRKRRCRQQIQASKSKPVKPNNTKNGSGKKSDSKKGKRKKTPTRTASRAPSSTPQPTVVKKKSTKIGPIRGIGF